MTGDIQDMKALIARVADGLSLSEQEAELAFDIIMSGNATPSQMGGFLMALRVRGETVEEITGAARTMRAKMLRIPTPEGAIDTVGTGGDGTKTYNISTAAAFVVAGAGVVVAKHGNRALSSRAGAADVLTHLGVDIDCDMSLVQAALAEAGICFFMAPRHHSAMRHVGGTRVELGTRTIFNILGPLSNPGGVKRQLIGVFSKDWVVPMAETLLKLGSERAWVMHGDGLDEITTTGVTSVASLENGRIETFEITPEDAGLARATIDQVRGGDPEHNATALRAVLDGVPGPYRDIVLMNAAGALIVAGKAETMKDGVALAAEVIDSGRAKAKLDALVAVTNRSAAS
ncbi:anthranilate phosphoribosyltransferase [Thalassobaculum fulvum]|uniref:Anthranilate phosphoribosyltransferase n=1 Tax=Thalassobaculum fulvum TaxID=1633335 RepID=A0A919CPC9_9PROT|nr:anthranilate phosphoribosyltransferase [Thalassobaculum fulvum]GHD46824.1 anthranilate phosphoribosyltransferase [Thalassobaculum fulvum]